MPKKPKRRKRRARSKVHYEPHEMAALIRERADIQRQEAKQLEALKQEIIRRETLLEKEIALDIQYAGFVKAEPLEQLHRDGTLAMFPSILRHLGSVTDNLFGRLEKAFETGGYSKLQRVATTISRQTSTPIKEVYTLYYSL